MLQQQGTACEDDENEDNEKMARPLSMILRPGFLAVSGLAVNRHSALLPKIGNNQNLLSTR
ncbi:MULTISPECIES: hypothetical protein [unclassified Rhizobium]|uniref:hypothetical protein n=1 Tax=unclassified Rhizobium TaxID=2613769 RepID=UPI000A2049B1|nr:MULTISPECIES: hypothetical protein [unclassified Rhizobium]ARO30466.1 hypothetical protein NXC14_CH02538 [Rhizobium sp. NXC14]MDK4736491.1 hypothetical protein [Rhizobium sp. CNPSo 3490]